MAAPRTKLFVGHLPDGCSNSDLLTLFEKYGTVKECDVINKYGFVHMSTPEEAEDAIKALNNYNFRGSSLSVERSKSKLHPEPGAPGRAKGGLSRNIMATLYRIAMALARFTGTAFTGRTWGLRGGGGYGGRGGYPRGGGGGYSNGYNRYDGPPFGGRDRVDDFYADRYGGNSMSSRMRPYSLPYDRPSMTMPRDDYGYRSSPYSMPSRDPYARPSAIPPRDMYERRTTAYPTTSDYLYSRRSPPPPQMPSSGRSYWYGDSFDDPSRGALPTATRRPYF